MWTKFRLQNFKGHKDTGMQELRRFTVLIGPNGGGKSTLLQFLLAFKQTVERLDTGATWITSLEKEDLGYVDLGQYKDYVFMGESRQPINIYLGWDSASNRYRSSPAIDNESDATEVQAIKVKLVCSPKGSKAILHRVSYLGKNDYNLVTLIRKEDGSYEPDLPAEWRGENLKSESQKYRPRKFYQFPSDFLADLPAATEDRFRKYVQEFESRISNTSYIGPLRKLSPRHYRVTGEHPLNLGSKGEQVGAVLYAETGGQLDQQMNKWLQRLDIAESVSLSRISESELFSLDIKGVGQRNAVNIRDYGFGACQILPVIVASLYLPSFATLLIEQPEIHLNAHHQLKLPDFFAELVQTTGKQFIIETHSEYFIKRLGTLVAKEELLPQDVIVLYCYTDKDGSHIKPIYLDELGQYSWWPEGFLSEGFEGATEHIEAIEQRIENDSQGENGQVNDDDKPQAE